MIALAAAGRAPQHAAALLQAMGQQHERGLGNWQAELAEWPPLFIGAHGALQALNDAFDGLAVDPARMRANIDALQGLIFAEALSIALAAAIGRPAAHAFVEALSQQAVREGRHLAELLPEAVAGHDELRERCDIAALLALFDPVTAAAPARRLAARRLHQLRDEAASLATESAR
jgi:3-carboxy-cis,cis-muconate cycloisomerase